jgi:hypothetical protein
MVALWQHGTRQKLALETVEIEAHATQHTARPPLWLSTRLFLSQQSISSRQEIRAFPRVSDFTEGFLSDPWQRKSLPSAALGTTILTALQPLPRVGPSARWDPRHNQIFAEGQRSARSAPSEKERAPSHLDCRPLCRWLCREAVGTDATCAERRGPPLGKGVDPGLPRLTVLCREPPVAVGSVHICADGPR